MNIHKRSIGLLGTFILFTLGTGATAARAWDHPGHMTTAAIAYIEVAKERPELMDKIGMLFLTHPEAAPFWVAAGSARGEEATRRKFIECARFADDIKFTATETRPDPDMNQDTDRLIQNMVKFILEGVAPVDEAPQLPDGYWEKLQLTTAQRITLAGYRMADLVLAAADNIEAQRKFLGRP